MQRQPDVCEARERLDHAYPRLLEAPQKGFAGLAAQTLCYGGRFSATTTANPVPELKSLAWRQGSGSNKPVKLTSALPRLWKTGRRKANNEKPWVQAERGIKPTRHWQSAAHTGATSSVRKAIPVDQAHVVDLHPDTTHEIGQTAGNRYFRQRR